MTPKSFRESRNWTLEQMGERVGIASKGYLSTLENGVDWPLELALRMQLVSDGAVLARDLVPEDKRELLDQLTKTAGDVAAAGAAA